MIELNAELVAEYLDQKELYAMAHMIKRRQDEESGQEATTYLGLQVSAPTDCGGERPRITGVSVGDMLPLPVPAWCHDPTGQEPPLGVDCSKLPAVGGASEPSLRSTGIEVSAPKVSPGAGRYRRGE